MKLRLLVLAAALGLCGVVSNVMLAGGEVYAECTCPKGSLRSEESCTSLAECNLPKEEEGEKSLMERVVDIINVIVGVVGVIAIVVVVLGAIFFVTSTGDAAKVTRARNTIIYGIVGLVVSLLAFAIVNFVTKAIFGGSDGGGEGTTEVEKPSSVPEGESTV